MVVDRTNNSADKVVDYAYQYYDANGKNNNRIRQITDNIETAYSTSYLYDDYNRLTNATANAFSRSYSFDEWGNIKNFSGLTLNYQTNASGAPTTNRIDTDSQSYSYTYDAAGNMTLGAGQSYSYDGANRLKTASNGTSSYGYDGDGKRVKKTEGGTTTYYVFSSKLGQSVMEVNSSSVQRAYVYGGGKVVAMQATDGQIYWLHTNHLGNSRAMTDTSGNLTYKGQFDPYGAALTEWSGSGNTNLNSKKFTGYERDSATGLDYAQARMYNSSRGRFTVPDMKGLGSVDMRVPQSLNRYAYTSNDPVNFVDPSGLDKEPFIIRFYTFAPYPSGGGATGSGGTSGMLGDDPRTKDPTGRSGGGEEEEEEEDTRSCEEINKERNRIKRKVVDEYLEKSGLAQFIDKKDDFKAGYMITFKNPQDVRNYINNHPELFGGGGTVGGLAHADDLRKHFGPGLGNIADWRTYKETTSTTIGLGNRSLQAVLYGPGAYVDTDRWNPNEGDVVNWAFHFFGEFLGKKYINSWKRCPED